MSSKTANTLKVTTPSDLEIRMVREFDAPRELVFNAFLDPDLIPRWWGPRNTTTVVDKLEARPGGKWRFINTGTDGTDHAFNGEFREITPHSRLVQTFEYEPWAGQISVETATFEEKDGKTIVDSISTFDTKEARDGMLNSGMESGAAETYDRLEELLVTLKGR